MYKTNYSLVSEFVFLGLSPSRPVQDFLLAFSTVSNLSFIDLCFSTLTVPKMLSDLCSGCKTISFQGCVFQIFVLHILGGSEMVLLTAMALDRYVAICKPLVQLAFVVHLPFCGPNEINSFYCDLPRFIKLACIDTYRMEFMVTANSGFITMGTFFLLNVSYVFILVTVWKRSSGSLCKALSTLSAHISVVILFFGPCIFVYMWPFPTVPVDKFLAILDFMITPLLNPAIYTLRNKDMKMAVRRLSSQLLSWQKIS
uniref:G-protein coupled receptors family 1 profile domain-containing protein n=1 Tax=Sus scrofa TaxID=9823 RepID=A0A4X1UNX4_PIG